ncbi:RIP metalloprotease RseP [Helicovermis profundi]|uniref:Zinc metalloprotease n=1 Tax=Helicovermis profundi TaxID=3065157 RepID=A0AAU9E5K0_9FIRM|nr:RIP metalloprotease RseP [Clostridia bacterium S502]
MITAISFILVFCALVFFHEFGHFAAAKLNGIYVHQFALGMGPVLFKKKIGETEYSLRLLPIGGFVNMEGEDGESDHPRAFSNKKPFQRLIVLSSGPIMNFVLALILFFSVFTIIGFPSNIVGNVTDGFPAQVSGIERGDIIKTIDGRSIKSWEDVISAISSSKDTLDIVVVRNSKEIEFNIVPKLDNGRKIIGVTSGYQKNFFKSVKYSFLVVGDVIKGITSFLINLPLKGTQGGDVVGPVGMVGMIGKAAKESMVRLLQLSAMISINLGIFNLLPLPALDGGRIVFVLIELLRGKPVNKEAEGKVHFIGFVLLMALMVFLVFRDISKF